MIFDVITQICSADDDLPLDWTVRHGRSSALSVALKEASPQVYTDDYKDKICRVLLAYLTGDRVCMHLCIWQIFAMFGNFKVKLCRGKT
jgi:hypothetical protein